MPQPFIELKDVSFEYKLTGLESLTAVDSVNMSIYKGSHVAILGRNGSGKSTLARLINGLEIPSSGSVTVDGLIHDGAKNSLEIRRKCGIVFQNPDNQIIGTTVEEDVAFGPENLGIPRETMIIEIDKALAAVGLSDKKKTAPHLLSGGQKQKLAIAGILAMNPDCFILDEATSMLDPATRKEFITLITALVRDRNMTIINITHDMEEAILSDYVYIMSEGAIVSEGKPQEVFDNIEILKSHGLDVPVHIEITQTISDITGIKRIKGASFTKEDAREEIIRICKNANLKKVYGQIKSVSPASSTKELEHANYKTIDSASETGKVLDKTIYSSNETEYDNYSEKSEQTVVLDIAGLSHTYSPETVFANDALKNVTFQVNRGELFGIVGQTGSGKSTLVQHFNGLIKPQTGTVRVMGFDTSKKEGIKEIRKRAGLLFQYPEHQLFEETVFKDVSFGPKCLGMSDTKIHDAVIRALDIVGLNEEFYAKSPFEISGGQKRRVAIAGIVAMEPDILILDEPAAGLDPAGCEEILSFVKSLSDLGTTVILVSHNMDDIARLADRVLVLKDGEIKTCTSPELLFVEGGAVEEFGISYPVITQFMLSLRELLPTLETNHFSQRACAIDIIRAIAVKEGVVL